MKIQMLQEKVGKLEKDVEKLEIWNKWEWTLMFELLTLFLTGGGSAAMGSILKGVFGAMTDARQQKYEMEMARRLEQ